MSDQLYRLYNYVGAMISRTGLVRHIGLATLAAKVDILLRRSLGSVATSPIMLDGVELHFPAEGHFDIELTNAGAFEPRTTRLLLNHLKPGMTFVDVGAHIGHFALVAASVLQEDGHVYAFEPDPVSFSFLQKNIAANGYDAVISPAQKAVADTVGEVKLHSGRRDRLENYHCWCSRRRSQECHLRSNIARCLFCAAELAASAYHQDRC
jgi:hypothetical protein